MKYQVIDESFEFNIQTGIITTRLFNQDKDLFVTAQYNIAGDNIEVLIVANNDDGLDISTNITQRNTYSEVIKDFFMNLDDFNYLVDRYEENSTVDREEYRQFMLEEYKREERYG